MAGQLYFNVALKKRRTHLEWFKPGLIQYEAELIFEHLLSKCKYRTDMLCFKFAHCKYSPIFKADHPGLYSQIPKKRLQFVS